VRSPGCTLHSLVVDIRKVSDQPVGEREHRARDVVEVAQVVAEQHAAEGREGEGHEHHDHAEADHVHARAEQNVRELAHLLEQAHVLEGLHEADEGVDRHPQLDLFKAVAQGHHLVVAVVVRVVPTWGKQVLSARGFKRVGRRSENAI
jgi:DNA-binding NtrC family response regulator